MDPVAIGALVTSIVLPALVWLLQDARAKGRAEAQVEKMRERDERSKDQGERLAKLELATALDHQTVDGFCTRIDDMRADMDKRFDKIEAMIRSKGS